MVAPFHSRLPSHVRYSPFFTAAGAIVLGLMLQVATPHAVSAFECTNSGTGGTANDNGIAGNTACGDGATYVANPPSRPPPEDPRSCTSAIALERFEGARGWGVPTEVILTLPFTVL